MISRIVLIFLLAAVAEAQGAQIKGTVILNGEDGPGVANVQINDSAHTGGPWASDSDGLRTEGTKATELLGQAVAACRNALEVFTRKELPEDWAATQSSLGTALLEQAMER